MSNHVTTSGKRKYHGVKLIGVYIDSIDTDHQVKKEDKLSYTNFRASILAAEQKYNEFNPSSTNSNINAKIWNFIETQSNLQNSNSNPALLWKSVEGMIRDMVRLKYYSRPEDVIEACRNTKRNADSKNDTAKKPKLLNCNNDNHNDNVNHEASLYVDDLNNVDSPSDTDVNSDDNEVLPSFFKRTEDPSADQNADAVGNNVVMQETTPDNILIVANKNHNSAPLTANTMNIPPEYASLIALGPGQLFKRFGRAFNIPEPLLDVLEDVVVKAAKQQQITKAQRRFKEAQIQACYEAKVCTYIKTGTEHATQQYYHCFTCNLTQDKGCCESCVKVCHSECQISSVPVPATLFFCDCGASSKCKATKDPDPELTYLWGKYVLGKYKLSATRLLNNFKMLSNYTMTTILDSMDHNRTNELLYDSVNIFDCRPSSMYNQSHVKAAKSLFSPDLLKQFFIEQKIHLLSSEQAERKLFIFYSDSSESDRETVQFLRSLESEHKVNLSEVYLLGSDYYEFSRSYPRYCEHSHQESEIHKLVREYAAQSSGVEKLKFQAYDKELEKERKQRELMDEFIAAMGNLKL